MNWLVLLVCNHVIIIFCVQLYLHSDVSCVFLCEELIWTGTGGKASMSNSLILLIDWLNASFFLALGVYFEGKYSPDIKNQVVPISANDP